MIDLAYLGGTVLFFALMLLYVKGCELLGRASPADAAAPEESRR
jgi:hypothetical protein